MRKVKLDDFACSCGDEKRLECAEIKQWAMDFLSHPNYRVTDADFVDQAIVYLNDSYQAQIVGIPSDQWFAIITQSEGDPLTNIRTYIQCDHVEDGIAFTLKAFYDHFGKNRILPEDDEDDEIPQKPDGK